jgi:hypothetical protein
VFPSIYPIVKSAAHKSFLVSVAAAKYGCGVQVGFRIAN